MSGGCWPGAGCCSGIRAGNPRCSAMRMRLWVEGIKPNKLPTKLVSNEGFMQSFVMSNDLQMHTVAHHLQTIAAKKPTEERDAYARSAYNRYYYAVFLTTRTMFREMDSTWSSMPHASYPEALSGKIFRKFKTERGRASRSGDKAMISEIDRALRSIKELEKIMIASNSTRKVADYEPEELVNFESTRFSLRDIDITEAHQWPAKTSALCKYILSAWRHMHV